MKYVLPLLARKFGSFGPGRISRLHLPIALAAVMAMGGPDATAQAPALQVDWIQSPINGHWYGVDYTPRSWTDSEALAVSLGGHLATIRSQAEQDWVFSNFETKALNWGIPGASLWFGGTDQVQEGTWEWSGGEPWTYSHWGPGEPTATGPVEDYTALACASWGKLSPGDWNDDFFPTSFRCLIESVTEPHAGWSWPHSHVTGESPRWLASGEVTGDAYPDLVVPLSGGLEKSIHVRTGLADGSLGPPSVLPCGISGGPVEVALSDFDMDGNLDIAATVWADNTVWIFGGDGLAAR